MEMVKAHLAVCPACREYYEKEESLGRSLQAIAEKASFLSGPAPRLDGTDVVVRSPFRGRFFSERRD
jgi:predicted anti-sigma-YlaC factor YlaD